MPRVKASEGAPNGVVIWTSRREVKISILSSPEPPIMPSIMPGFRVSYTESSRMSGVRRFGWNWVSVSVSIFVGFCEDCLL